MARKKLNKKVALIGSAVFIFAALAIIGIILRLSRDPDKFIQDGDTAFKTANETVDEQIKEEEYRKAESFYKKAYGLAKTDALKIEMMYRLADIYIKTDKWIKIRSVWNQIVQIDPKSINARYGQLKYFYIVANSGANRLWKDVEEQASEFIDIIDEQLFNEDTAQWDSFEIQEEARRQRLGPYLYFLRGRAVLQMTMMGAVTDQDESLARAVNDLEKFRELEPENMDVYWHLALADITKGNILASMGKFEERQKARQRAIEVLEQAVEIAGNNPKAHINLLKLKFMIAQVIGGTQAEEQVRALEPEYLSLVQKFPSNAKVFSNLTQFYMALGHESLDEAIQYAEKATELDNTSVAYAANVANLHYLKSSIYGHQQHMTKAIEIVKDALTLPDAQDKPGPKSFANKRNRIRLESSLANWCIEQVLQARQDGTKSEAQIQDWIKEAEQAIHEIEQFYGSGENPIVVKWQGMLEFAKGNRAMAVRKLYPAYEQFKVSGREDAQLSYILAKIFEDATEIGVVAEFMASAGRAGIGISKPEARLYHAEVLLKLYAYETVLTIVNNFEQDYWTNERSRRIRIRAQIGARQLDEAEKELEKLDADSPQTIKLSIELVNAKIKTISTAILRKQVAVDPVEGFSQTAQQTKEASAAEEIGSESIAVLSARLKKHTDALAALVGKLLQIEPDSVALDDIIAVCDDYITQKQFEQAKDHVSRYLEHFPTRPIILVYKHILSEPEPDKVSQQRVTEIKEKVFDNLADPMIRAAHLGLFYKNNNEHDKAVAEFKKVLKMPPMDTTEPEKDVVEGPILDQEEDSTVQQQLAALYLFDMALESKDWQLAERLADLGHRKDLDKCEGRFFAARLAMAKGLYEDALALIDESLKLKPIFPAAYMERSKANAAMENWFESLADIQKAWSFNPMDKIVSARLAGALYQRNQRLGGNASSDQILETRTALERAIALNPGNIQLYIIYSEYISDTNPERALSLRQRLYKASPTLKNAVMLGQLATEIAVQEKNTKAKEALFDIAASTLEQARKIDPQDKIMLYHYAEYYRLSGQDDKARQLLAGSDNQTMLWNYLYKIGQYDEAKKVLEQLYQNNSTDVNTIKGLWAIADKTGDREAIEKCSQQLLSLEDNTDNHLFQIQSFLQVGLTKEAELKLQSFNEKFPNEPRAMLLKAWLLMRQGRLKSALEAINQCLGREQNNATAWRLRGELNFLMTNNEQAINDLSQSKALADDPGTEIALAKAYISAERIEDAITELENTIDTRHAPEEAVSILEKIYWRLDRKKEMAAIYWRMIKKYPDDFMWYNRIGAFALANNDPAGAEKVYLAAWQKSRELGSGDQLAFGGYLQALLLGKKLDKLFAVAGKYVDTEFAHMAFYKMADAKMMLGDRTTAIQYCRKAIDKAGEDQDLTSRFLQGMYELLGADEVLKYCQERLRANPDSLTANFAMFNFSRFNNQYNKAVDYIDKCIKLAGPDSPHNINYIIRKVSVLQSAYNKTSDNTYYQRAVEEYENILTKRPNNPSVLNNLAYMLAENNERLDEALRYAESAYELLPNDPGFLDTYSYVLYRNGKYPEAERFMQAALQQYEQNKIDVLPDVYEHLGMIEEKLGATDQALAAYRQALKIGAGKFSKPVESRITSAIERLSN